MIRYSIPGQDYNLSDLENLDIGSSVLLEVNGVDCNPGYLANISSIASTDWLVTSKDKDNLMLSNSLLKTKLILSKDKLINDSPAVFEMPVIMDNDLRLATIITKMIAYYADNNVFIKYLEKQSHYKQFTKFSNSKIGIEYALSFIWNRIRNLDRTGWGINSINRFALKSGVDINIVFFIRQNDYAKVVNSSVIDYNDIKKLFEATFLFHLWYENSKDAGIKDSIINLPSWKNRRSN